MQTSDLPNTSNAAGNGAERRREPRRPASGPVRLTLKTLSPRELDAELLDVSTSGFRISHRHGLLALGTDVTFRHPEAAGHARVVWNWVLSDHVETGFVVIR
ncbi:MAG: PilZ domain-containing protein [Bryobacteraceae bacterium]